MNINNRDLMLEYLSKGWSVFPLCFPINNKTCSQHGNKCKIPGKAPLCPWLKFQKYRATATEVNEWVKQFGETNVAIVCGKISDIVVLDIDTPEAKDWVSARKVEPGPIVHTGKIGGYHHFFKWPGYEINNFAGSKILGLDFRGDGGYVVSSGSKHYSGKYYGWLDDTKDLPLPDMPKWLLDLFSEKESVSHGPGWIGKTLNELREGNRNESLHAIAGWLRRYGATNADSIALLQPHAARVGLSYKELEALVASAGKYPVEYKPKNVKLILDENGKYKWVKDE